MTMFLLGDLNFDMPNDKKCQSISDICDVFNISQLVSKPTCFMKGCTLVDLILTNKKQLCFNIQNLSTWISDFHNLISVTIKGKVTIQKHQTITFRSYRNFDIDLFNTDIVKIKLPEINYHIRSGT